MEVNIVPHQMIYAPMTVYRALVIKPVYSVTFEDTHLQSHCDYAVYLSTTLLYNAYTDCRILVNVFFKVVVQCTSTFVIKNIFNHLPVRLISHVK
jgi:hypothetical protein